LAEAEIVRLIFHLAKVGPSGTEPAGVKIIAGELNRRNLTTRNGRPFSSTEVHNILHRTTYVGRHIFNVTEARTKQKKPPDKQIIVPVPAIIDEATFKAVHAVMRERDPMRVAVRFTGRPTLLSNLARHTCGGAMTLSTGKSGRYRYYTCSKARRIGNTGCPGRYIPESLLDGLVIDHLADVLFEPNRLRAVIEDAIQAERRAQDRTPELLDSLLRRKADLDGRIGRMHQAIECGMVKLDDADFAGRLEGLKRERAEIELKIPSLRRAAVDFPPLTIDRLRAFSAALRSCLRTGEASTRRAYLRLLLDRVTVDDREIILRGHRGVLAEAYAQDWRAGVLTLKDLKRTIATVPPQVEGWRPRWSCPTAPRCRPTRRRHSRCAGRPASASGLRG
jgi:site-specific DNA recombinase